MHERVCYNNPPCTLFHHPVFNAEVMRQNAFIVCAIWGFFLSLELLAASWMVGFFTHGMTLECHVSYLFGFGYFLCEHIGIGYVGPIPISDWRWILGVVIMAAASLPPALCRSCANRKAGYAILILVHLLSLKSLFSNMAGAIT